MDVPKRIAIIGGSGSGKTTLGKEILIGGQKIDSEPVLPFELTSEQKYQFNLRGYFVLKQHYDTEAVKVGCGRGYNFIGMSRTRVASR